MRLLDSIPKAAVAAIALAALLAGTSTGRQGGVALAAESAAQTKTPIAFSVGLSHFKSQAPVLYLKFHNLTQVPADTVRFLVDLGPGNDKKTITETGHFHPGVTIERTYQLVRHQHSGAAPAGPQVTVEYVHFTDGTSWQAN
jgi:hypothetical protein